MVKSQEIQRSRAENILAYMAVGVTGLAILCILLTLILKAFSVNPYVILEQIPMLALPLGALLIISLFITSAVRRGKADR
jgi:hypothetical protein